MKFVKGESQIKFSNLYKLRAGLKDAVLKMDTVRYTSSLKKEKKNYNKILK